MSADKQLSPQRPYLLRALYEWICDNDLTPYIVVRADYPFVQVPIEYVKNGQIILNIAPQAVTGFSLSHALITFNARFGGLPRQLDIPIGAVLAIFARENNAGMGFPSEPFYEEEIKSNTQKTRASPFSVVNSESTEAAIEQSIESPSQPSLNESHSKEDKLTVSNLTKKTRAKKAATVSTNLADSTETKKSAKSKTTQTQKTAASTLPKQKHAENEPTEKSVSDATNEKSKPKGRSHLKVIK